MPLLIIDMNIVTIFLILVSQWFVEKKVLYVFVFGFGYYYVVWLIMDNLSSVKSDYLVLDYSTLIKCPMMFQKC